MAYHILMSTINGRQFDIEYFYLSVFPEFFSVVDFNGYTAFIANVSILHSNQQLNNILLVDCYHDRTHDLVVQRLVYHRY
jgi:hypothetical protein